MTPKLRLSTTGYAPRLGTFGSHSHPFVRDMWQAIIDQKVSVRSVAHAAGVDPATLHKWRRSIKGPTLAQIDDVLSVLGYELTIQRKKNNEK
jgi:hypothetical protein